ncbi:MAG: MarR family winged helix-turn-helix transcriptional regulator [Bacillota bacterium]
MEQHKEAHLPEEAMHDSDILLVFGIMRTHAYLLPYLDRGLKELRLTAVQLNVLLILRTMGDKGLNFTEIGKRLHVTKANITGLIDRMEQRGLVKRENCRDRRITVAKLTPEGEAMIQTIFPAHKQLFKVVGSGLTVKEKDALIKLLAKLRRHFRETGLHQH